MLYCRPAGEKRSWWSEVWSIIKWHLGCKDKSLDTEMIGELTDPDNPKDPGFVLCQRGDRNYMCPKRKGNKTMTEVSPAFIERMVASGYQNTRGQKFANHRKRAILEMSARKPAVID